jgi:hypothetical protein
MDSGRFPRVGNALALAFMIIIGIAAGSVLAVAETIEDKLRPAKRHSTGVTDRRP